MGLCVAAGVVSTAGEQKNTIKKHEQRVPLLFLGGVAGIALCEGAGVVSTAAEQKAGVVHTADEQNQPGTKTTYPQKAT